MRLLMLIVSLALTGCATTQLAGNSDYSDLYTGRSQVVFATELPADSAAAAIQLGDQAFRRGESDQALFHYLQSLKLDDSGPVAFHRVGIVHRQRGNLQLASRAFRHVLERDDRHLAALEELGLIMLHEHELEAASRYFNRVLTIDTERVRALNGLGVIADLSGDHVLAARQFRQALELQPGTTHILNNLGYSLYLTENWDEAEKVYNEVLKIDQEHELATRNLALLHVRRGQHQRALRLLERVGTPAAANNDLGYLCMLEGQHELADRFLQKAIELSPAYYEMAHTNLTRNRALAKKAPDPRLARLFSPNPERIETVKNEKYEDSIATAAVQTTRPASSQTTQRVVNEVRDELPPIVASESIPASEKQAVTYAVSDTRATGRSTNPAFAKPPSQSNGLYLKRFVHADSLNVRDDSSQSASVKDKIRRGRVVRVLRESGEWAFVLYWRHNGNNVQQRQGWVHASFLSETDRHGLS